MNGEYRGGFVLAPVGIAIACGSFFLIRGKGNFLKRRVVLKRKDQIDQQNCDLDCLIL